MAYPRFKRARSHKKVILTSGDLTVTTAMTSYTAFTATALDIQLEAAVGDDFYIAMTVASSNQNLIMVTDFVTVVSSSFINYCSGAGSGGNGVPGLRFNQVDAHIGYTGFACYTIQAGDISSGQTLIRPVIKYVSGSTNMTIAANANEPIIFYVENKGPADQT